jgi:DNA-binding MarR family transcriptional regulator
LTIVVITTIVITSMKELGDRLKQTKPFIGVEEEVTLAIQVIAEDHRAAFERVFKERDLTATQYNVLRILRGAGEAGLCCRDVADRMITREPDITRLLDRLENRGLLRRERQAKDRRVISVFITDAGLAMLATLDEPVAEAQKTLYTGVTKKDLEAASRLLAKMLRGINAVSCEGGKQ